MPSGATFTANASNTSGTFDWVPSGGQAGSYTVTFTASNALSGSATTSLSVTGGGLGPIDLTVAGATYTGADGVVWQQLVSPPAGTGVYNAFLRLQANGIEEGMNSDASPTYNNVAGVYTHSLTLGELMIVTIGGTSYYSLALDINEVNGPGSYLSLDQLQIFTIPGSGSLMSVGAVLGAGGVLRFDLDALMNQTVYMDHALAAGTGHEDIQVLIPTSYFAGASAPDNVYLYCRMGGAGTVGASNFDAEDGFEEWHVLLGGGPPPSNPPMVSAPGLVTVEELGNLSVIVTASDADGLVASLAADLSALPAGNDAAFTANLDNTDGTLVWHPALGSAGTFPVTFTAVDNDLLSGSATTSIEVVAVGAQVVAELNWTPAAPDTGSYTVTFTATDAESLTATASTLITVVPGTAGSLVVLTPYAETSPMRGPIISVASSATVRTDEKLTLTVSVYPDLSSTSFVRAGLQTSMEPTGTTRGPIISCTADLTQLPTTNPATFTVDTDPEVSCPASVLTQPSEFVTFQVGAGDPDGDPILRLEADFSTLPSGALATFTTNASQTSGTFAWTPQVQDVSDQPYPVVFTAANVLYVSETTLITVRMVNHEPVADAGGPYAGYVNAPLAFDGGGSMDPDGDALQYSWSFGDGSTGVGPTVSHTYASAGTYTVTLTVQETSTATNLSDEDSTDAIIGVPLEAKAFTSGGNKVLRLRSGKPAFCAQLEPLNGSFLAADVDLASIVMRRTNGAGSVTQVSPMMGKTGIAKDADGNGVLEVSVCFSKEDLVLLLSDVSGRAQVPVELAGRLSWGPTFSAPLTLDVIGSSGTLAASVAPNPFNPFTTLSFETPGGGPVHLLIFDLAGRLVRDVTHGRPFAPGYHDVVIDGRDRAGRRLASGVYFYRLSTKEGSVTGRLVLLE